MTARSAAATKSAIPKSVTLRATKHTLQPTFFVCPRCHDKHYIIVLTVRLRSPAADRQMLRTTWCCLTCERFKHKYEFSDFDGVPA